MNAKFAVDKGTLLIIRNGMTKVKYAQIVEYDTRFYMPIKAIYFLTRYEESS